MKNPPLTAVLDTATIQPFQFDSVANVTYPGVDGQFLERIFSVVSLELRIVLSGGCIAKIDFHYRIFFCTLRLLIELGLLGVPLHVAARKGVVAHKTSSRQLGGSTSLRSC